MPPISFWAAVFGLAFITELANPCKLLANSKSNDCSGSSDVFDSAELQLNFHNLRVLSHCQLSTWCYADHVKVFDCVLYR